MNRKERERRRLRRELRPVWWLAPIVACVLMTSSVTIAIGEGTGTTDTSTLSVSILPPGGALTIVSEQEAVTESGDATMRVASTPRPATVSAMIRFPAGVNIEPGADTAPTFITVMDDRGTGAGWDVMLTATDESHTWAPVLQANAPSHITRLIPAPGTVPAGQGMVSMGGTVRPLQNSMVVLYADEGSGSGTFVQTLTITWPLVDKGPGLVSVQLPSAP